MEAAHIRQGRPKGIANSFLDLNHIIYLKIVRVAYTIVLFIYKDRLLDLDIILLIGYAIEWVQN